jgi:uncharacterized protein (TIGR02246 family)
MLKSQLLASIVLAAAVGALAQSRTTGGAAGRNEQDEKAIRAVLNYAFEESWNSHEPARAVTPDRCVDEAIFINTTGGWVTGCQKVADMVARLHALGGPFEKHTRRHVVEDLRFIRPDVALAVVRTTDIRIAGKPAPERETRGLVVLIKEDGHWKTVASQNTRIETTPNGNR